MMLKRLLFPVLLCLLCHAGLGQGCPPNIDFEKGSFEGWQCFTGITKVEDGKNVMTMTASDPIAGIHEMFNTSSLGVKDRYGNFPVLCPYGGQASVKLGNDGVGAQAEGLTYTFTVPNVVDTFSFTYYYAVVFQDPNHPEEAQPRFFVSAYDVETGEMINCASYDYIATGGIPGFKQSRLQADVLYKEWSPVTIQFAGLANRQVRLEFRTADCTLGGHFGYAYVDVGSGCSNILATAPYCAETNSLVLNAPYGFKSYTWYNSDFTAVIGTEQTLTLSPPPVTSGTFYVDIVPYPGYGCRDTASATVLPLPVPPPPQHNNVVFCRDENTSDIRLEPLRGHDVVWYASATGGTGSQTSPYVPSSVPTDTVFWISQKELFGCESIRKPIAIKVQQIPDVAFQTNNLQQCLVGNNFNFLSTSTNTVNSRFYWHFGDGTMDSISGTIGKHQYSTPGNYSVKLIVTNDGYCAIEAASTVHVGAHPVAGIRAPQVICENEPTVRFFDNAIVPGALAAISGWWWEVDGQISTLKHPPPVQPHGTRDIVVAMVAKTPLGCVSDTLRRTFPVRYRPVPKFDYSSLLCNNEPVQFTDRSSMPAASPDNVTSWRWQLDQGFEVSIMNPVMNITSGLHKVKLVAISNFGCESEPVASELFIHPKPDISLVVNDSCVRKLITFESVALLSNVTTWIWDFGAGAYTAGNRHTRTYSTPVNFPVLVVGKTNEGCKDTVSRAFRVFENTAKAGSDTIVAKREPVQLDAGGGTGLRFQWSPSLGLNDHSIRNPVATMEADQLYKLYSISEQGCESISEIFVKRYEGPELYIPNAFTPDKDGKNDQLKCFPVGIRKFHYLSVYSRTGQLLYRTTNYLQGWDGTLSGVKMDQGTYVAVAQAEDYRGRPMMKKTTVVLIR